MKKIYLFVLIFQIGFGLSAQNVSFTYESLNGISVASSACAVDMNGDFIDDVLTVQGTTITVYDMSGSLTATNEVFSISGMWNAPGWSIAAGDYNDDGYNDLLFGDSSSASFIKSDGDGYTFVSFPEYIFSQRTNFVDIDNDGNLDAFACHDVDQSHSYKNDGSGNMVLDLNFFPTLDVGGNYASIWTDYNNDGLVDMYLSKCRGGAPEGDPQRINLLYKNNGDGTFTESGEAANMNDGDQSWSTAFADFDNDGDMDAFISNISGTNKFMLNNGNGTFTNITGSTGINANDVGSWEVQAADFNNDGFVDIFSQMDYQLYLNNGDLTFTGQTLSSGEGGIGDFNNDGFLDFTSTNGVYFNTGNDNNWIKITVEGVESNRNGIGARIELHGEWGTQIREIRSGEGFSHMNSLNTYFGIGTSTEIDQLVVNWPSGNVDIVNNPQINETTHVVEGASLGITNIDFSDIEVFPNPAEKILTLLPTDGTIYESAIIYNINGKLVAYSKLPGKEIDVSALSSGTYILLVQDTEGKYLRTKFIKK
ncbi:MAG TPA: FG-GAP-like repeat-containing protein [Salinimicrobium sp.]|nr:FG-GAP-like repeat-containing protein [Salinimicrobium sp.]